MHRDYIAKAPGVNPYLSAYGGNRAAAALKIAYSDKVFTMALKRFSIAREGSGCFIALGIRLLDTGSGSIQ